MMRFLLIFTTVCCLPSLIKGEDFNKDEIMQIAYNHLQTVKCSIAKKTDAYCVIQRNDTMGYVIISLCGKRKAQVIGYSEKSMWDTDNIPPALSDWLNHLEQHYESGQTTDNTRGALSYINSKKQSISPLLTCHWHQKSPYNDLAPVITDGNVKTVAGCVAIAAAQITYYWRKDNPEYTLKDTPLYPYGAAPITMSIKKGTPNNWNLIQDNYTSDDSPESKHAVAQLCYVLGTTSYLNYASSTGGSIFDAANAIYSQYDLLSTYTQKSKFEQGEWEAILYNELSKGYPVMCAGSGNGAHAFVLDGYDSQTDLYHFNFGWGGTGDGYYPIDDSDESMGGYYQGQTIVYDIHPQTRNIKTNMTFDYIDNNRTLEFNVSVTNNSTLSIERMCLYVIPEDKTLDESYEPEWYSDSVRNDNIMQTFTFQIKNLNKNISYTFYLTDENGYLLSKSSIEPQTGIKDINSVELGIEHEKIYDLKCNRIFNVKSPGIYIVKNKKQNRKLIIKK